MPPATAADIGLRHDEIHEARKLRDAEAECPGLIRRTLGLRKPRRATARVFTALTPPAKPPRGPGLRSGCNNTSRLPVAAARSSARTIRRAGVGACERSPAPDTTGCKTVARRYGARTVSCNARRAGRIAAASDPARPDADIARNNKRPAHSFPVPPGRHNADRGDDPASPRAGLHGRAGGNDHSGIACRKRCAARHRARPGPSPCRTRCTDHQRGDAPSYLIAMSRASSSPTLRSRSIQA